MENLLTDYYMYPEEITKLNRALCDLYCGRIEFMAKEFKPHGFWTSDDLGHQTGLMMPRRCSGSSFCHFIKKSDDDWRGADGVRTCGAQQFLSELP